MVPSIEPVTEAHFDGLRAALDAVARERRYLAFSKAPEREDAIAFYRDVVANDWCQFVAILGGEVVGWCDVLPVRGETRAHVGVLGIGLVAPARHLGIGTRLMRAAIERAWAKGMTRIELNVRADNLAARSLYERFGFRLEGNARNVYRVDGQYFDGVHMALLRDEGATV